MFKFLFQFVKWFFVPFATSTPDIKRARQKMMSNPQDALQVITHTLGSSTGPISLKRPTQKGHTPANEKGEFTFSYVALDQNGSEAVGAVLAESEAEAINTIRKSGLYPTSVNRAFTLIELLVVITILGILTSICIGFISSPENENNLPSQEEMLMQRINALESENAVLQKLIIGLQPKLPVP